YAALANIFAMRQPDACPHNRLSQPSAVPMPATRVRLIAPSGYPHDRAAMSRGVARLCETGCTVDGLDVLERTELRYAGNDAERAADLIALAIRGGYGATRLLEHLHYDALRERLAGSSIVLVGHSDFTAIQLALHAK